MATPGGPPDEPVTPSGSKKPEPKTLEQKEDPIKQLKNEQKKLSDDVKKLQEEVKKITEQLSQMEEQEEEEEVKVPGLQQAREYKEPLKLDPATAHAKLIVSKDGTEVRVGDKWQNVSNSPRRFNHCLNVLAKESFSEGMFYFEVQVKDKTGWTIGVIRESVSPRGVVKVFPAKGCWAMRLRNGNQYKAQADCPVLLSLKRPPQKVGVFVDYGQRLISFYDADAATDTDALICSITECVFTKKLYPFFSPGPGCKGNSGALVINPVKKEEETTSPPPDTNLA